MRYSVDRRDPRPARRAPSVDRAVPGLRTADGQIIIAAGNDRLFVKWPRRSAAPDLGDNPDFKTNALRHEHHEQLEPRSKTC